VDVGAEPVIAGALDAAAMKAAVARIRPDAVINELTSLPRRYTPDEMGAASERHREVLVEGNINLLAARQGFGALQTRRPDANLGSVRARSSGFRRPSVPKVVTTASAVAAAAIAGVTGDSFRIARHSRDRTRAAILHGSAS
jgi:2-alkyl-3-oxoalkanoate reductase